MFHFANILQASMRVMVEKTDKLAGSWLGGYINVYIYIYLVISTVNREHQRFCRINSIERRNVLLRLNVHLCCVWRCFKDT